MNPEEGDLRPQLLDRFGLSVTIKTPTDKKIRMEIVNRRLDFVGWTVRQLSEFALCNRRERLGPLPRIVSLAINRAIEIRLVGKARVMAGNRKCLREPLALEGVGCAVNRVVRVNPSLPLLA